MTIKHESNINFGYIKIRPTLNNIFITLTDYSGNVLITKNAGMLDFKSSKKRTPYAAAQVLKRLLLDIEKTNLNVKTFIVQTKGHIRNKALNSIMYQFKTLNLPNVLFLEHLNIQVHNGMRAKKKRRL